MATGPPPDGQGHAPPRRRRGRYAVFVLLVVAAGLGSRSGATWLPQFVAAYAGDTLWAVMFFLLFGLAMPARSTPFVAGVAWAWSISIELSQLWHTPLLDAARGTPLGALLLGRWFLVSDLVCLSAGVAAAALAELAARRWACPAGGAGRRS